GEALVPTLPYVRAEGLYAARYEMAHTLDDILSRRTRALLLARDSSAAAAPEVAALVGPELGWSEAEVPRQTEAFRDRAAAGRRRWRDRARWTRSRGCSPSARKPVSRSPPPPDAAASAARRPPCTAGWCSTWVAWRGSSTSTTRPCCSTCGRARSATCSRTT